MAFVRDVHAAGDNTRRDSSSHCARQKRFNQDSKPSTVRLSIRKHAIH